MTPFSFLFISEFKLLFKNIFFWVDLLQYNIFCLTSSWHAYLFKHGNLPVLMVNTTRRMAATSYTSIYLCDMSELYTNF